MRATLNNTDGALVPGLFARVQLAGSEGAKPALLINERAVNTDQNRKFVFVVDKDNKAEYRRSTGPDCGRPARGARWPEAGREDRRQRPAARASRRADHAEVVAMDVDPLAAQPPAGKEVAKEPERRWQGRCCQSRQARCQG
jgi:multidrug efflux system membrane fusion protein